MTHRTVCIVQARLGSSRLPAKVLLPLPTGRAVLEEVLHRCKQIPGIDEIVCAVPDTAENDVVADMAKGVLVYRGSEHDLLARYLGAAEAVNADVIMRITADCPLLDPQVCGDVLALRNRGDYGYATNAWPARHFPHGYDCEVFTMQALCDADRDPYNDANDREHVGPAIRRVLLDEKRAFMKAMVDRSHLRWTLDTLEDYVRICVVLNAKMAEAA